MADDSIQSAPGGVGDASPATGETPPVTPADLPRAEDGAVAKKRRGCVRGCLRWAGLAAAAVVLVALWQLVTWPDASALATENPSSTAFIERWERRSGQEARRTWVPYGAISNNLKHAVVVSEDIDFFSHDGFAHEEQRKALEEAWEKREIPRGASTLTQQLAKNLWLSPSKNPLRKAKEALLTRQLEKHLQKRRILELYLNVAEMGPGIFGAEAAARHYFGKSAASLSQHEAAALAAGLPNPREWHPGSGNRRYQNRVGITLRRMGQAGWVRNEL